MSLTHINNFNSFFFCFNITLYFFPSEGMHYAHSWVISTDSVGLCFTAIPTKPTNLITRAGRFPVQGPPLGITSWTAHLLPQVLSLLLSSFVIFPSCFLTLMMAFKSLIFSMLVLQYGGPQVVGVDGFSQNSPDYCPFLGPSRTYEHGMFHRILL